MKNNNTKKNNSELQYEDTTFFGLLKTVKLSPFKKWSLFWAIVFTLCILLSFAFFGDFKNDINIMSEMLATSLLGASAAILAIVIAGLAITIALFKPALLPHMLKTKFIQKLLFPFWLTSALWGISIIFCIILVVLHILKQSLLISILFSVELFTFFFATFYTIALTGVIIRFALQNSQI